MLYKNEVYKIIGAAMEVYNELDSGFLEPVYHESLEIELSIRDVSYRSQTLIPIYYKEKRLNKEYYADLICYENIIVELKATDYLTKTFQSQLLNYLHANSSPLGLLVNFGREDGLEWKRMVV